MSFANFERTLFAPWLLPIIPVGAPLTSGSTVPEKNKGKTPGFRTNHGEWYGHADWTKHALTGDPKRQHKILGAWDDWYPDGQPIIGINARLFPAVDIDINNPFAETARDVAFDILGPTIVRGRPNSQKKLLMYRLRQPGYFITKQRRVYSDPDGNEFAVEILGKGQQYLIEGRHPSGVDYAWVGGKTPLIVGPDELPEITPDQVLLFVRRLDEVFGSGGIMPVKPKGLDLGQRSGSGSETPVGLDHPDQAPTIEMVVDALSYLSANDPEFESRDDWEVFTRALKTAVCGNKDFYAEYYLPWNLEHPDNDETYIRQQWDSHRTSRVGWSLVASLAGAKGYTGEVRRLFSDLVSGTEEQSPESASPYPVPRSLPNDSDIGIARCVAEDLRSRFGPVAYCEGGFWFYDADRWRAINESELRRIVHRYDGEPFGKRVVKLSKNRVDSVIHEMGAMLAHPDFFNDAPSGINCATGFIRFAADGTPSLEPHDSEHRCRHVLKGKWDGKLTGDDLALALQFSPLLGQLLRGVFLGDPDVDQKVQLLQEIAGAAATGYGTQLRDPKAVILKGETAENGKSQILDLYRSLLPPEAVASIPAAKMDERYLPQLAGKYLNAADELSGSAAIASDTFKSTVTGEPVTGREVYRTAFTFRPVAQHVFCTNALPSFSGGIDRGVARRLLVITFNRVIPKEERVEHIGLRIGEEEADLLLAWAVEGASRLIRQRDFTIPPSSKEALHDWLHSADPVLAWVQAGGVVVVDPNLPEWKTARIKSKDAYSWFKKFAVDQGFRENTLPAITGFVQRLTSNRPTIVTKHTNAGNWLVGIQVTGIEIETDDDRLVPLSDNGDRWARAPNIGVDPRRNRDAGDIVPSVH